MSNVMTNIATIGKPNKYNKDWTYSFYNGGTDEQFVRGFETRKAAVAALKEAHPTANVMSNGDYNRESGYGRTQARRSQCVYTSYATNG
jgi:hypothetical protein